MYIFTLSFLTSFSTSFLPSAFFPKYPNEIFTPASQLILSLAHILLEKGEIFYLFWCIWTSFTNSWRDQTCSQYEISQTVAPFWPFSLLLYDFKTEFKIKWLVHLVALFLLLLPPCQWTAASQSALPSGSIKLILFTPLIYIFTSK